MKLFFLIALLASGLTNSVFSILILRELSSANIKVGYFESRWHIHKNLKTYKEITRKKTGRVSPVYYGYLASFYLLIAFVTLLLAAIAR